RTSAPRALRKLRVNYARVERHCPTRVVHPELAKGSRCGRTFGFPGARPVPSLATRTADRLATIRRSHRIVTRRPGYEMSKNASADAPGGCATGRLTAPS